LYSIFILNDFHKGWRRGINACFLGLWLCRIFVLFVDANLDKPKRKHINPDLGELKFLKKFLVNLVAVGDRNNS
ncbi:MAG: hypothetical protein KGY70_13945, partial [Bacteroidales bacterium]|nr:hypothetical protein [Bacteroidales bacterium]